MSHEFTDQGYTRPLQNTLEETTWNDATDPLLATTGTLHRIYATEDRDIEYVHASTSTANSGGTTTFDINIDGTTILASDLTIADTDFESAEVVPTTIAWDEGAYMTVEVTGVTGGASKATVTIAWRRRRV